MTDECELSIDNERRFIWTLNRRPFQFYMKGRNYYRPILHVKWNKGDDWEKCADKYIIRKNISTNMDGGAFIDGEETKSKTTGKKSYFEVFEVEEIDYEVEEVD